MRNSKHIVDILFVVSLFALYTVCILIISIIGINLYINGTEISEKNYTIRTSALYLTEKARQNNIEGGVKVKPLFDANALVLTQEINGRNYENWIYLEEGYLTEVLIVEGAEVLPRTGQNIMPLERLTLKVDEHNLLIIETQSESGDIYSSKVYLPAFESEAVS